MLNNSTNINTFKQNIEQMNLMRIDDFSKVELRPSSDSLVCNIRKPQVKLSPEEKEVKELYNDPYSVLRRLKDQYFFMSLNRKTPKEELEKLDCKINQAKHFCGFIKGYYDSDYDSSSDSDETNNYNNYNNYEDELNDLNDLNDYGDELDETNKTSIGMYDVHDDLYDDEPVTQKENNDGFTLVHRR